MHHTGPAGLCVYAVDNPVPDRNNGVGAFVKFCKIGALSATGTRPFDAGADGFVMGEGGAIFLLKRLAVDGALVESGQTIAWIGSAGEQLPVEQAPKPPMPPTL